ncbi:acetolactate synthase small subunit [Desulfobotulus alkaliphilus]|uniref:Acetolactate synthase small subunit n=1 Tax=Desulfobotulus alkaliphilus TaxID=622671 RepID=A0A562RT41_9BACT|nr:acetolactate synthase small subunit [Desulfobotulus alkaliphilus]TWI72255.1 acetolactate synthase small subunit [Desulfobotulus alkaliphilus]
MNGDKSILSILVDNEPGVLSRITGLFSGRGYNIESLSVAETMEPGISRITMITRGDKHIVEQIKKQLNKLINVIKVLDFTEQRHVLRELALIKVHARAESRAEVLRIVDIFRCKIVDSGPDHYTLEVAADEDKLSALLNMLQPMGIKEIARTGSIALVREMH